MLFVNIAPVFELGVAGLPSTCAARMGTIQLALNNLYSSDKKLGFFFRVIEI